MKISIIKGGIFREAEINETESVLQAVARSKVFVAAPCGGRGTCGKCRARLVSGKVSADTGKDGTFLMCRAKALSDIEIELIADETAHADGSVTPVTGFGGGRIEKAGIAADIGTTTVSLLLYDIGRNIPVESVSFLNPQGVMGADVISRIDACRKGGTHGLFGLINKKTEETLRYFIDKYDITIGSMIVSGNTVMQHLFTDTDASGLGEAPFTPVFTDTRKMTGQSLNLSVREVVILPSMSAFVGADIVSGLASLDSVKNTGNAMLIDLGTNGEIALISGNKIFSSSAAAGPALEGAGITCGTGGVNGAINKVWIRDGKAEFATIGNAAPSGITGSGLIDAVALMLDAGAIDETGAMTECGIAKDNKFRITESIYITDKDIRQFQLVKSAIRTAVSLTVRAAGLRLADINTFYIAGGLGYFIDIGNAVKSGLLPEELEHKAVVCGNLSLKGAGRCLSDKEFLARCESIRAMNTTVDLTKDPSFSDEFMNNMFFG